jgi:type I restriction enzyme S subunit
MDDVVFISPETHESMANSKVRPNDVLLNITGASIGRCCVVPPEIGEANVNQHVAVVRSDSTIEPRFLAYLLSADPGQEQIVLSQTGSGREGLTFEAIRNFAVPLPLIPEQKQIAAFLDWKTGQIDALIARKQELLEKLKEKRLAVITQAVTRGLNSTAPLRDSGISWLGQVPVHWDVVRFSFFIGFQEGPGIMAVDFRDEGIPLLRIRNVQTDIVDLEGCNFLDPEMVDARWNNYRCKAGDLLISCSASTGLVSEVDEAASGAIPYTGIIRLWPQGNKITQEFIRWLVSSDLFFWQIKLLQTGSTMLHFGPAHLSLMQITLPPVTEQSEIAEHLNMVTARIDALVESNLRMISMLTEYRTALITAATTGKIDVRNVEIP